MDNLEEAQTQEGRFHLTGFHRDLHPQGNYLLILVLLSLLREILIEEDNMPVTRDIHIQDIGELHHQDIPGQIGDQDMTINLHHQDHLQFSNRTIEEHHLHLILLGLHLQLILQEHHLHLILPQHLQQHQDLIHKSLHHSLIQEDPHLLEEEMIQDYPKNHHHQDNNQLEVVLTLEPLLHQVGEIHILTSWTT